jgi:hypothetical protein
LLEQLLSIHSFYKFETNTKGSKKEFRDYSLFGIRRMLTLVRYYLPRVKGNGWKAQKFHELLHLPRDVFRFGYQANYDAGPGESALRFFAKKMAETAKKEDMLYLFRKWECDCGISGDGKISSINEFHGHLDGLPLILISKETPDEQSVVVGTPNFIIDYNEDGVLTGD